MRLSIGRKFQLYVTGAIVLGALLVFLVVRSVIKKEYAFHFTEEIKTADLVLENYLESRFTLLKSGIDILLADPRFLAAIAEGDPTTAQHEVASFRQVVQADIFLIADATGKPFAGDHDLDLSGIETLPLSSSRYEHELKRSYLFLKGRVFQILTAPLTLGSGQMSGKLLVGYRIDQELLQRLKHLTGSDVLLLAERQIVASTDSKISSSELVVTLVGGLTDAKPGLVHRLTLGDEEHLLLERKLGSSEELSVLLVRSLDAQLSPAIANISLFLILLTLAASIVSLVLIYRFTSTKLTAAVDQLVDAAGKISTGNLEQPIHPLNDDELGYLAKCFDEMRQTLITNRETIARVQDERIQAERLATIGQLAAGIIHDFKSPMTAIALSVEAITHGLGGESKRASYCSNIKNQVQRMVNMTQDLLDYAHGNKSLQLEQLPFVQTIQLQVEFHRERYDRQRVGMSFAAPDEFVASFDQHKLRRVVDNLLNNAFEALSPGHTVAVSIERDSQVIQVHVRDDGPGIPPAILQDIFKPFVTHGKSGGTGLGLAISHKIVIDHGGDLKVASEPGCGAHFTICLPAKLVCDDRVVNVHKTEVSA